MAILFKDINKILIIGSGTMGLRIGLMCALKGYDVVMYDLKDEILAKAAHIQSKIADELVAKGRINKDDFATAKERINLTTNIQQACHKVNFVSENTTEEVDIKQKVFYECCSFSCVRLIY